MRKVPIIKSMMRRTIKAAFRRPVSVMWNGPQAQSSFVPGVKNRFKTPVKTMMNSTGFRPFTRALRPTFEIWTQAASTRAIQP